MNDEDLRDLFAAFAMVSKMWIAPNLADHAKDCYRIADAMLDAKYAEPVSEPEMGITAIKRKRKTTKEE
jgi:hypothetical protein